MADKKASSTMSRRSKEGSRPDMAIGSFRRQEEIGRGSFATVYKASVSVSKLTSRASLHSRSDELALDHEKPPLSIPLLSARLDQSSGLANTSCPQKKPGFVAIKSVDVHRLNKKLKENLYSEIHILKGLRHPHIVALIDCKESTAHIHLVMEFCELGDLSYFIKKKDSLNLHNTMKDTIRKYPNPPGGGLNEVIVRHFLKQLTNAIEFLRIQNYIHRDVKPQNLLLDPSPHYYRNFPPEDLPFMAHERSFMPNVGVESLPTLKLADFGFARSLPTTSLAETLCGSPLYMAPEILRYEKYDARVDLWSIGTVLYEMLVGKPPFKASNHVELLRKIEKGEDRISFPSEIHVSDSLKRMVRGLLKRHPDERMSFQDFFNHTVIKDEIPGLTQEDRALQLPRPEHKLLTSRSKDNMTENTSPKLGKVEMATTTVDTTRRQSSGSPRSTALQSESDPQRRLSGTPPRAPQGDLTEKRRSTEIAHEPGKETNSSPRRPSMLSHATAPARQDLYTQGTKNAAAAAMERKSSRTSLSSQEKAQQREKARQLREARERAAQEVAFERDYVVVEKRAVEVNAFADELAASPRIRGHTQDPNRAALVRRATQQGPPASATGAQASTPSRAVQVASGKRPEIGHHRRSSYERRLRDTTFATSAISKAISLASGRLFGMGFSPPLGVGRTGTSPPSYSPFPAYPTNQGSLLMLEDAPKKSSAPTDEDIFTVQVIEDNATRSDVVFGFAEVKYKQLIPLAPSIENGLGLNMNEAPEGEASASDDEGLTVDATVTLSEEALVLYVKALTILAKAMDIAGAWWSRKTRVESSDNALNPTTTKSTSNMKVGNRINNVVQWVRSRFNETLEKAEFVRLKLLEAQKHLPADHPSHPNNHPSPQSSVSSADQVIVTSGLTAEKLMYERAVEMSRSAALSELVNEDLPGCELAYVTAMRMLEAVLEDDDSSPNQRPARREKERKSEDGAGSDAIEAEDRDDVSKSMPSSLSDYRHG